MLQRDDEERLAMIKNSLEFIYDKEDSSLAYDAVLALINEYREKIESKPYEMTEKDVILITYGDQIFHEGETALATLNRFLNEYVQDCINSVHILPFYPYSSDDGFSIVDYKAVCPLKGSWKDIKALSEVADEGIMGAITGRAIYEGTIDLTEAQAWLDQQ